MTDYSNTTVPPLAISLSATQNEWTPVMQASQEGHVDVVNVFLDHNAKVNHLTSSVRPFLQLHIGISVINV